nr:DNA primase [Streptomyces sp. SID4937]
MWSRARETHGPRRVDRRGPVKRVGRTRAQAADVPLDDEAGAGADDEEEAEDEDDDEALDFASEPVDEDDEPESDDFEVDVAGVLLDEEPRLSFR